MKIVYIYPQFVERAGTERILADKMNYLADHEGYEIVLLTYEQCARPLAFHLSPKILHVDLDMRYYLCYKYNFLLRLYKWWRLDKVLQKRYDDFIAKYRPDIVITTTSYSKPVKMVNNCPIPSRRILESHIDRRYIMSNNPRCRRNLKEWLLGEIEMRILTKNARKFDCLVALNQPDADDWSRFLNSIVITNIVHLNSTRRLSSLENKRVIFVGRYTEQKGIPDLLKIWENVHSRFPDWSLDMFGEGEMRNELICQAELLNSNIHVNEPSPDIFNCYMNSSILVVTSLYEPFGLVIPEAMSCGLPVVAFDCPFGPAKIVTDGVDGFLIPNRDEKLFEDQLCNLIENKELRKKMGKQAAHSSQRYRDSAIMPIWVNLFQSLVK